MAEVQELPRPVTAQEIYLHDIAQSLRQLGDVAGRLIVSAPEAADGDVALRESPPAGTALPDDFPGRAELAAAGILSREATPRTAKRLKALDGIDEATATAILQRLSKK